jgi:aminopeptidase N
VRSTRVGLVHLPALLLLAAFAGPVLPAARADQAPVWFPPDESGWPGAWAAPGDVAPYLSFHKQRAFAGRGAWPAVATPAQQAYDVTAYDLDLRPDLGPRVLWGSTRVRARVVAGPLDSLDLDFTANMTVDSIRVAGAPGGWARVGDILRVALGAPHPTGAPIDLTVWYHGTPAGGTFGTAFRFTSRSTKPLVWTISEPFGARTWWPCKDVPEDKADSVSVRVTMPTGMITGSNGTLVSSSDDGTWAVREWRERHPITTYLVSIASYAYSVVTDWYRPTPSDSMPLVYHLFPDHVSSTAAVHALIPTMISEFAARFGEYPFLDEKYGHSDVVFGGGMEHQTMTSLGSFLERVVAHELAHQWWGDLVTCRDFHHIWLNEGFATYSEALWAESQEGPQGYHDEMAVSQYFGPGTVWVPDEQDEQRVFDGDLTYDKGSWVLHMLRHVMGDAAFFDALLDYRALYADSTAVTEDLRDVCEARSGRDLDRFFQQWVYGEGHPQYRWGWSSEPSAGGGHDVTVVIGQEQSEPPFWMPVDVVIHTAGGASTFVAWDSLSFQPFTFHVDEAPVDVEIDPDEWILRTAAPYATGVEALLAGRAIALAAPVPNPARRGAAFSFSVPRALEARLAVFDVRGARVWERAGRVAAGEHAWAWDGLDRKGRAVPSGLYLVRLETEDGAAARRLAVIR